MSGVRALAGLTGAVVAIALTAGPAVSAASTVASSRAGTASHSIGANDLKPPECAGITLTNVVSGSTGTGAADLLLGSAGADTMSAKGGNDCVLGGGGNDSIDGGAGTDVCLGGPGTDTFANCETATQ